MNQDTKVEGAEDDWVGRMLNTGDTDVVVYTYLLLLFSLSIKIYDSAGLPGAIIEQAIKYILLP